jgi:sugar lactone lactonase YvrE
MLRFSVVCHAFMCRRQLTRAAMRAIPMLLVAAGVVFCPVALAGYLPTAHFTAGQRTLPTSGLNFPQGVAVDSAGNLYVADVINNRVVKETLTGGSYSQSTIPTSALHNPEGVAVDAAGNVYIADAQHNRVLKETVSGDSYSESTLPTTALYIPLGVAVDQSGNVFIVDSFHNRVLKETPSGGTYTESIVPTSFPQNPTSLYVPMGVAVDAEGNLYITDIGNSRVLKETLSGGSYTPSLIPVNTIRPSWIAVDGNGNVYIVDPVGGYIEKDAPSGGGYIESVLPGGDGGVAVDAGGNLYVADNQDNQVFELQQSAVNFGPVNVGSASGKASVLLTFDTGGTLGGRLVLTQGVAGLDFDYAGTGSCSKGTTYAAGDTCTVDVIFKPRFSGTRYGAAVLQSGAGNPIATGNVYGTGLGPQTTFLPGTPALIDSGLANPYGLAVDAGGNIFFADSGPDSLYNRGNVYQEKLSGGTYSRILIASGLVDPTGVAVDGSGIFYVAAGNALYLYKQTLFDGSYHQTVMVTDLSDLAGIAVDRSGNLYLISSAVGDAHKETLQASGSYTETAVGSGIAHPTGVAVDGGGNLYITDARQGEVYKEALQANGSYIQSIIAGGLAGAQSVAVDGNGNLYITLPTSGEVLMEALQTDGSYLQSIAAGGLNAPWGIAVDGQGNLYYSHDTPKGGVETIDVADTPSLSFAGTEVGSASADSPQSVTVSNIGNAALDFPVPPAGANPSIVLGPGSDVSFMLDTATTCLEVLSSAIAGTLDSGSSCVYAIDFVPVAPRPSFGSLVLLDTNQNAAAPAYFRQLIGLHGTGIASAATRTTLR